MGLLDVDVVTAGERKSGEKEEKKGWHNWQAKQDPHHKFLATKIGENRGEREGEGEGGRVRNLVSMLCYFYICPFFILRARKRYWVASDSYSPTPQPPFLHLRLLLSAPPPLARREKGRERERERGESDERLFSSHLQHQQQHIQQCCGFTSWPSFKEWRCETERKKDVPTNSSKTTDTSSSGVTSRRGDAVAGPLERKMEKFWVQIPLPVPWISAAIKVRWIKE